MISFPSFSTSQPLVWANIQFKPSKFILNMLFGFPAPKWRGSPAPHPNPSGNAIPLSTSLSLYIPIPKVGGSPIPHPNPTQWPHTLARNSDTIMPSIHVPQSTPKKILIKPQCHQYACQSPLTALYPVWYSQYRQLGSQQKGGWSLLPAPPPPGHMSHVTGPGPGPGQGRAGQGRAGQGRAGHNSNHCTAG